MTREEAIKNREECVKYLEGIGTLASPKCLEAVRMSVVALKAQQAPAKLDRILWEGCEMCRKKWSKNDWSKGGAHDFCVDGDGLFYFDERYGWEGIKIKYCPFCGRPLTEAAWAELERKIGGNDGTAD